MFPSKALSLAGALAAAAGQVDLKAATLPPCANTGPLLGANLIGTNSTDITFVTGPGYRAFETVPAPQGNPNLYQKHQVATEFIQPTNGYLASVEVPFFASQNVSNKTVGFPLPTLSGDLICSVWTNGVQGFMSRSNAPDFELNAGSVSNLVERGSITNALGANFPVYVASACFTNQCVPLTSGDKYAVSMRVRLNETTNVFINIPQSTDNPTNQNEAAVLGSYYIGPASGGTLTNTALTGMKYTYAKTNEVVLSPYVLSYRLPEPGKLEISLKPEVLEGRTFVRFECADRVDAATNEWVMVSSSGTPPKALIDISGPQKFFRAVATN